MDKALSFIDMNHFYNNPFKAYQGGWQLENKDATVSYIWDDCFECEHSKEQSWSSEIEEIHEEPTQNGWIDVYERQQVKRLIGEAIRDNKENVIVEFGSSVGYMIEEIKNMFPENRYVAIDMMPDGLEKSYMRNKDIFHIQGDFTNAPFRSDSIDVVYALNVLEHITDDKKAITECYRVLKRGGVCLFVVPRGEKLFDYYDETLYHKRRYAKGEIRKKAEAAGFEVIGNFHLAWFCYPFFWLKKKMNRIIGSRLTQDEKLARVKADIKSAMSSSLAVAMIHIEEKLGQYFNPSFGVRELILLRKV